LHNNILAAAHIQSSRRWALTTSKRDGTANIEVLTNEHIKFRTRRQFDSYAPVQVDGTINEQCNHPRDLKDNIAGTRDFGQVKPTAGKRQLRCTRNEFKGSRINPESSIVVLACRLIDQSTYVQHICGIARTRSSNRNRLEDITSR
jgi:hypothetical protein